MGATTLQAAGEANGMAFAKGLRDLGFRVFRDLDLRFRGCLPGPTK